MAYKLQNSRCVKLMKIKMKQRILTQRMQQCTILKFLARTECVKNRMTHSHLEQGRTLWSQLEHHRNRIRTVSVGAATRNSVQIK